MLPNNGQQPPPNGQQPSPNPSGQPNNLSNQQNPGFGQYQGQQQQFHPAYRQNPAGYPNPYQMQHMQQMQAWQYQQQLAAQQRMQYAAAAQQQQQQQGFRQQIPGGMTGMPGMAGSVPGIVPTSLSNSQSSSIPTTGWFS